MGVYARCKYTSHFYCMGTFQTEHNERKRGCQGTNQITLFEFKILKIWKLQQQCHSHKKKTEIKEQIFARFELNAHV